jgi:formylglycine-generating enzyme required for sulfatase activity
MSSLFCMAVGYKARNLLLLAGILLPLSVAVPCHADGTLPEIPVVAVKGGCFEMGDSFGDGGSDEKPLHEVCVDDFRIGRHEVTQELWQAVMGSNPSKFKGNGQHPVENVSWDDARDFIRNLNEKSGRSWRLPTEAEWEYAARSGGLKQRFAGTSAVEALPEYAWHEENSNGTTHAVGTRQPNGLGLYDMSGNVWEWCADRYDRGYYKQSPRNNPKGDPFGINRILRGGAASSKSGFLRASYRDYVAPVMRGDLFGLRLVLDGP